MLYQNKINNLTKVQKMVFISMLIAFALVLSYLERTFVPIIPIPGVKLGLANIISLTSLYFLTFREAMALVVLRVTLNSFFAGSFFTIWYSLSGGILSLIVMFLLVNYSKKISTTGISIIGAVTHNFGQLIVLAITTESINVAAAYSPFLAVSGIATGILIGLTASYLLPYINRIFKG